MSEEYITRGEHKEFAERIAGETKRQNERIKSLEKSFEDITRLAISTEKLATNMEKMVAEQERQGVRISKLEGRDGEKWRNVVKVVGEIIIGAVIGAVLMMIGLK